MKIFLISIVLSFSCLARIVVVSDIDDTIKQSYTLSVTGAVEYYIKDKDFPVMKGLFKDFEEHAFQTEQELDFHYVSASYSFLYDARKWVLDHKFPLGTYNQRKLKSGETYEFKYQTIATLLANYNLHETTFYFFGDNSSHDQQVYLDLVQDFGLNAEIYIRDVNISAYPLTEHISINPATGVQYFISGYDLQKTKLGELLTKRTKNLIQTMYEKNIIVAEYLKDHTETRLEELYCNNDRGQCEDEMEELTKAIWKSYYSRIRGIL